MHLYGAEATGWEVTFGASELAESAQKRCLGPRRPEHPLLRSAARIRDSPSLEAGWAAEYQGGECLSDTGPP